MFDSSNAAACTYSTRTESVELRQALTPHLLNKTYQNNQLQLFFAKSGGVADDINNLIEAERACCSFLELTLVERQNEFLLTVQSTKTSAPSVEEFFNATETPAEPEARDLLTKTSTWSSFVKPLTGVVSLCMLCCAVPYMLLFTGLVGASTAAYLSSKVEILIGAIIVSSLAFVLFRWQSRNSRRQVKDENIGGIKDAGSPGFHNPVLRKERNNT